jgi:hypothetical protein
MRIPVGNIIWQIFTSSFNMLVSNWSLMIEVLTTNTVTILSNRRKYCVSVAAHPSLRGLVNV